MSIQVSFVSTLGGSAGLSCFLDEAACDCLAQPGACGESSSCINRLLMMECSESCPARRFCSNKRFKSRQYAEGLEVRELSGKGCGLFAAKTISCGTFIIEYVGQVLTHAVMSRRMEKQTNIHFYCMTLAPDQIIDASEKGNVSRFMNHSCLPNCLTQKWIVDGRMRIGLFAFKDIAAGSELTFDYKFECYGETVQKCLCGESICKGTIGVSRRSKVDTLLLEEDGDEDEEIGVSPSATKKCCPAKGIDDPERISGLIKELVVTRNVGCLRRKLEVLHSTTSIPCLRRFLFLHGLKICAALLKLYLDERDIVYCILEILEKVPLTYRNGIDDSGIVSIIDEICHKGDKSCSDLSYRLLKGWEDLPRLFTIPKRTDLENTESDRIDCGSPSLFDHLLTSASELRKPKIIVSTERIENLKCSRQKEYDDRSPYHRRSSVESAYGNPMVFSPTSTISPQEIQAAIASTRAAAVNKSAAINTVCDIKSVLTKQLKHPVSEVVRVIMSRYRNQMTRDFFKETCRKITHMYIDKEAQRRIIIPPFSDSILSEKDMKKLRYFVVNYLHKLGYKIHDEGVKASEHC